MEHTKKLYPVDEFDRIYKQLQRPARAVAKAKSSIRLSRTLGDDSLSKEEKVRQYIDELHRYLHTQDSQYTEQQRQQQAKRATVKRTRKPVLKVNTQQTAPLFAVTGRSPPSLSQRVLRSQSTSETVPSTSKDTAYYVVDDDDDDVTDDDEVYVTAPVPPTTAPTAATSTTTTTKSSAGKPPMAPPRSAKGKNEKGDKKKKTRVDTSDWAIYQ